MESLPIAGGGLELLLSLIPGIAWVLIKAWLLFAVFVWIRASLHRVRTDQILEFGWQWLLPCPSSTSPSQCSSGSGSGTAAGA